MKNYTLTHHGILGQRWGIGRYQNKDGTLTEAGKKRYSKYVDEHIKTSLEELGSDIARRDRERRAYDKATERMDDEGIFEKYMNEYNKKRGREADMDELSTDDEFLNGVNDLYQKIAKEELNKELKRDIEESQGFKKAEELLFLYGDQILSDFATKNFKEYYAMLEE